MKNTDKIKTICDTILDRIQNVHITSFHGMEDPIFLISNEYPGLWMEHTYNSILLAAMNPDYLYLAENAVNLFLDRQSEEGQLPYAVRNGTEALRVCYWQIQECVSFFTLCLEVYRMNKDTAFLEKIYRCGKNWDAWLRKARMTTGRGLIEMFCGFDTGHDNSGRLTGISCPGNNTKDGVLQNAAVLPPDDGITPILAVDMNCNFYGDEKALAEMARLLGKIEEADAWEHSAADVKDKLFRYCWNEEDGFFYDVDRHGNQRKYRSSTIFHLFLERVLDPAQDKAII
ncbi:MAG: hypothetical protein IKL30_06730, partial [Anaerotignum sp.]|nr:hypothetical protein [Anaerotignum sp.]